MAALGRNVRRYVGPNSSRAVCGALADIVTGSKENTVLLISLGGAAVVADVTAKWPDNNKVQSRLRRLATLIAAETNNWVD
jgi:hypothetical protein